MGARASASLPLNSFALWRRISLSNRPSTSSPPSPPLALLSMEYLDMRDIRCRLSCRLLHSLWLPPAASPLPLPLAALSALREVPSEPSGSMLRGSEGPAEDGEGEMGEESGRSHMAEEDAAAEAAVGEGGGVGLAAESVRCTAGDVRMGAGAGTPIGELAWLCPFRRAESSHAARKLSLAAAAAAAGPPAAMMAFWESTLDTAMAGATGAAEVGAYAVEAAGSASAAGRGPAPAAGGAAAGAAGGAAAGAGAGGGRGGGGGTAVISASILKRIRLSASCCFSGCPVAAAAALPSLRQPLILFCEACSCACRRRRPVSSSAVWKA